MVMHMMNQPLCNLGFYDIGGVLGSTELVRYLCFVTHQLIVMLCSSCYHLIF